MRILSIDDKSNAKMNLIFVLMNGSQSRFLSAIDRTLRLEEASQTKPQGDVGEGGCHWSSPSVNTFSRW